MTVALHQFSSLKCSISEMYRGRATLRQEELTVSWERNIKTSHWKSGFVRFPISSVHILFLPNWTHMGTTDKPPINWKMKHIFYIAVSQDSREMDDSHNLLHQLDHLQNNSSRCSLIHICPKKGVFTILVLSGWPIDCLNHMQNLIPILAIKWKYIKTLANWSDIIQGKEQWIILSSFVNVVYRSSIESGNQRDSTNN